MNGRYLIVNHLIFWSCDYGDWYGTIEGCLNMFDMDLFLKLSWCAFIYGNQITGKQDCSAQWWGTFALYDYQSYIYIIINYITSPLTIKLGGTVPYFQTNPCWSRLPMENICYICTPGMHKTSLYDPTVYVYLIVFACV